METMLVEHIVKPHVIVKKSIDRKGNTVIRERLNKAGRVGTFIALKNEGMIKVGWAICNFHAGDKFNAEAGIAFATVKALNPTSIPEKINRKYGLRKDFQIFMKRSARFFKGNPVVGYDPRNDVRDEDEGYETLRKALRAVLPEGQKHLADGPIMGFGDGMKTPIVIGSVTDAISDAISDVIGLIKKELEDTPAPAPVTPAPVTRRPSRRTSEDKDLLPF